MINDKKTQFLIANSNLCCLLQTQKNCYLIDYTYDPLLQNYIQSFNLDVCTYCNSSVGYYKTSIRKCQRNNSNSYYSYTYFLNFIFIFAI